MFGFAGHQDSWIKFKDPVNTVVFKASSIARITESNGEIIIKLNDGYDIKLKECKLDDVLVKMGIKLD